MSQLSPDELEPQLALATILEGNLSGYQILLEARRFHSIIIILIYYYFILVIPKTVILTTVET